MAEEYRGSQYDDDLTVGLDDFADDSFDTGYVDLFEYAGAEESPISRLKTIMLSIEWEITDELLINFNDELVTAQQAWAGDQVKLVYIQALQKISKYIYQKKSDAHHNAMKVMLAFFYDLEKIVLDTQISEQEKREILFEDVKKFERLKQQIGLGQAPSAARPVEDTIDLGEVRRASLETGDTHPELYNLKAYILGIDWEITDKELTEISREVGGLQSKWSSSKPHMLLLQGIDALGGYIKLMKSRSHADAFKLLNSFFLALETVFEHSLGNRETKELLLGEVKKFNRFKEEIADTITPEAIAEHKARPPEDDAAPALSDGSGSVDTELNFGDTSEFEQTAIAEDIGENESFSEETLEKVSSFFGDLEAAESDDFAALSTEDALRGVDVETEADDDSDEAALPTMGDGVLAPALAGLDDDIEDEAAGGPAGPIQGVDVETEADDDSGEAPLPVADGEIAPALFEDGVGDDGDFSAAGDADGEISRHVDDFFGDDLFGEDAEESTDDALAPVDGDAPVAPALSGIDVEDEEDEAEVISDDVEVEVDSFLVEESAISDGQAVNDEQFAVLKTKVEELETEISAENLASIRTEIEDVKEQLSGKPIEKTLTNLVSTVVQNIDTEAGRSNAEALALLQSVFGNLEQVRRSEVDQNRALELLSSATENILQWQQKHLSR